MYDEKLDSLRLELAAMLDIRVVVATTYALEGGRLELLLVYDRVEALRALGASLKAGEDGVLPNVDAVLRRMMELKKGVEIEKHFDGHGICSAKLEKKESVDSTLYPGQEREAWLVRYTDGHEEHFEEEELRSGKHGGVSLLARTASRCSSCVICLSARASATGSPRASSTSRRASRAPVTRSTAS